jgi:prevent-host-death family protein
MKKASITEAKNNLSALIDSVKGGSPVLIVDRGRPVARLEPVSGTGSGDDSRLARLVRDGIVRPARGSRPTTATETNAEASSVSVNQTSHATRSALASITSSSVSFSSSRPSNPPAI